MDIKAMNAQTATFFLSRYNSNQKSITQEKPIEYTLPENKLENSLDLEKQKQESLARLHETIKRREAEGKSSDKLISDFESRGKVKQSVVISDNEGSVKACIGEDGTVSMCDWTVYSLWKQAGEDHSKFVKLLEENGYTVEKYQGAKGPTYAEVFEKMHGIDYYNLDEYNKSV